MTNIITSGRRKNQGQVWVVSTVSTVGLSFDEITQIFRASSTCIGSTELTFDLLESERRCLPRPVCRAGWTSEVSAPRRSGLTCSAQPRPAISKFSQLCTAGCHHPFPLDLCMTYTHRDLPMRICLQRPFLSIQQNPIQ